MKLITRDTDYAIRALCLIARHKRKIFSVRELVEELKIPRPFLRKILQILNKKNLIKSYKGKGGGFTLTLLPKRISLLDLIVAFQGSLRLFEHTFKKKPCPYLRRCLLKKKLDSIEKSVMSELKSVTILSLLKR